MCSSHYYTLDFRHKSICGRRQTPFDGTATSADPFSESKFAADGAAFPWLAAVHVDGEVCSGVFVSHRDDPWRREMLLILLIKWKMRTLA